MNRKDLLFIILGIILLVLGIYLMLDFLKMFFKFIIGIVLMMISLYFIFVKGSGK
jgi:hypothetical protein